MTIFIFQFQNWLQEVRAVIGDPAYNTGINGIATTRNNLAWSASRMGELAIYFENGYVEYVFEE